MKELHTTRFTLRRLQIGDIAALFEMDSDPKVVRYVRKMTEDLETYTARIQRGIEARAGSPLGIWTITHRGRPDFQGWVALKELPDTQHIEVGYRLPFRNWGQGIATETARRLLAYGFLDLGLPEIVAVTHPHNVASQRVIAKIGLVLRGTEFHYGTEVLFYSLHARDFSIGIP